MKRVDYDSPAFIHDQLHNAPYSSSLATSASASSSSVWSNASSQNSDDTSITAPTSDIELGESACPLSKLVDPWVKPKSQQQQLQIEVVVPSELRQNPRRSSTSSTTRSGCPPPLVRQADRKVNFVDNLVDSATQIVEAIWPTSSVFCRTELNGVLPLRTFIQETLRRSRSSYSTLQVALYYLILIKPHVPAHDFTMEQPDDCHASRALQCGRRMFLAALILASKYLQDRNYSSRAWSKISGLATNEINQNETAFLLAVNWKLHITEEVYHRWTDCVMKFSPQPPPPSSPSSCSFEQQVAEFRGIILKLTPELDNLEDLAPCTPVTSRSQDFPAVPHRWSSDRQAGSRLAYEVTDVPLTPQSYGTPSIMEPPTPTAVYTPGRMAPAMGLLPTPRLTPQPSAYSTPAVTAVSHLLGKPSSMGFAMAQISSVSAAQALDRWPGSSSSSPQSYLAGGRRSSLANTISTASSPESMVSDSSRASRSSSISSASSLASAPSTKLDVLARRRSAKQCGERACLRPAIASVPEDYEETRLSSSPESYTGPVAMDLVKEHAVLSLETPLGRRERAMMDEAAATRTALDLHGLPRPAPVASFAERKAAAGVKRRRQPSLDVKSSNLQDNVREMLSAPLKSSATPWSDNLVRARLASRSASDLTPIPLQDGRKRLCCSTEALQSFSGESTYMHPSMTGLAGPGMWQDFLP